MSSSIQNFVVKLEPRHYYYRPNDKVIGELFIKLKKPLLLKKVKLVLVGVEKVFYNGYVTDSYVTPVIKQEREILFHNFNLVEMAGVSLLSDGEHHLPFEYQLPNQVLSSFNGIYGKIEYYIKANVIEDKFGIAKSNRSLERPQTKVSFDVIRPSNFSVNEMRLSVGGKVEKTMRFLIFKRGSVRFSAHLDRKGYFVGESVSVNYSVANRSSVKVIPRATLYRIEKYFTTGERLFRKNEIIVNHSNVKCIEPFSICSDVIWFKIPFDLKVCSFHSSLIKVEFKIHVTIDIPNSFDLHLKLPLLVSNYVF